MPEILADQYPHPPEAGVESAHRVPPGEEAAFIEQTIGRQVDFVVYVKHFPLRQVCRSDIKAVTAVLIHKTNHDVQVLAGIEQGFKYRVSGVWVVSNAGNQVLKHVAG